MAPDVSEGTGAGTSLEPPTDRGHRVTGVVTPVPSVNVQYLTERPRRDQLADRGDGRCTAEREADPHGRLSCAGCVGHRPSIVQRVAERLLAQHMLPGGDESLHHLAVQRIGHDDADYGDV